MSVTIWEVLALCATHALPEEKSTRPTKHEKNGSQELTFSSNSQKEIVFEIRIHFHANRINILQYNWFNLSKILVVRSTYTGYPQDFNIFPTSFHHALDMELQMLFGRTLNLNWIPPRLWHISDIFSPCPWSRVADTFWSYAQPELDTPKDLTHFRYLFAMPLIWSCRCFLVGHST